MKIALSLTVLVLGMSSAAAAPDVVLPGLSITVDGGGNRDAVSNAMRVFATLTVLALAPAILIAMTGFTRVIIVLAILRQAIGMPETPPNTVLISLALFLTLFTMQPVLNEMNENALVPYSQGKVGTEKALDLASRPLKDFMIRQTSERDMALMIEVSRTTPPASIDDIGLVQLVPAFMLSEIKTAFQIGFVVFLPFLLIDLIVSSVLMAMGMLMVPPISIALPIKILVFVLIDGWSLLARALVGSFH